MAEEGLVRAAARGDERALDELVRRLAPGVHAFMTAMLGDGRDAAEATQETFVRMARSAGRFDGGDPDAWVFGLARRVAADHVLWHRPTSPGPFGSLPHTHREVLVLRETLDWDVARIAEALDVTSDEVRERLLSARDALVPSELEAPADVGS